MKTQNFVISAFDRAYSQDGLTVCRGGNAGARLDADTYNLRSAYILVFDKHGDLYEGGANLSSADGSVQKSVSVPAGGFAVLFGASHPMYEYYLTATEGAVIYNSTVSLIYPLRGEYDPDAALLSVEEGEYSAETENTVKYLFVGNSCTYINGNPIKFKALCRAAGIDVSVDYCTYGNAYFYEYADEKHPRGQALRRMLENKKYDYIVLQDGSSCELNIRTRALETLLELVKKNGATPFLYMRYGYEPDKDKRIAANADMYGTFMAMGDIYNIPVCPVAMAFTECILKYPDIDLYADDGAHHSKAGSYLAACCYLKTFCGVSPVGNGYTAGLDKDIVGKLQNIAQEVCTVKEPICAAAKTEKTKPAKGAKHNSKSQNGIKWALVGAGVGAIASVAAIIAADVLRRKLKKRKK